MRFYVKCPKCSELDFTRTYNGLVCNKCNANIMLQSESIVSIDDAPSLKVEAFIHFLNQEDFKWNGKSIETFGLNHLKNIKGYIERTCKSYLKNPNDFRIYQNILAEINKRVR